MRRSLALAVVAGLASLTTGQGLTITFEADRSVVQIGETVHWSVYAQLTGYPDPTAYFGGFIGVFLADGQGVGAAMNPVCHMQEVDTPLMTGASVGNVNMLHWAGLDNDDPANPLLIYEHDVEITAYRGSLSYEAIGYAGVFPDDTVTTIPDEYFEFPTQSDTVTIGLGCNAADVAEPYGLLDQADITRFVELFLASDPEMDLDASGVFDLADVVVFVVDFTAGCP
jgi:hypothetical protein